MTATHFILSSPDRPDCRLRTIDAGDIERLRVWKNAVRDRFFFKDVITPEMQSRWFAGYLDREHDYMLVVEVNEVTVGCIGFRRLDDRVDVYNVILGETSHGRTGLMAAAIDLVQREAMRRYPCLPVGVSVLRSNPALQWYFRRGFTVHAEHPDYLELARSFTPTVPTT